jgi:pseudomonalisin
MVPFLQRLQIAAAALFLLLPVAPLLAQGDRISGLAQNSHTVTLRGTLPSQAQPRFDRGRVLADTPLGLVMVSLTKTAAQQADLEKLLEEQHDRSSPNYRHWLTPEQYANRFGATVNDTHQVASWLRSRGLAVERVARGRSWVTFSGSAGQIERAFHTEIHQYLIDGEQLSRRSRKR